MDLYSAFRAIATESFAYKSVYLIMGVLYFVIIFVVSFILKKIEGGLLKNDKTKLYTTDRKIIAVICFNDYVIILKDNYFSEIIKNRSLILGFYLH
jgi:hypothetical protein